MNHSVSEAEFDAEFRRTAPKADPDTEATESSAAAAMSAEKAFDVIMAGDRAPADQVEEARRVIAAEAETRSEFTEVLAEIEQLAKSKLGMSPDTASLIAKSEALAAQEAHASLDKAVEALRTKRDALVNGVRS